MCVLDNVFPINGKFSKVINILANCRDCIANISGSRKFTTLLTMQWAYPCWLGNTFYFWINEFLANILQFECNKLFHVTWSSQTQF